MRKILLITSTLFYILIFLSCESISKSGKEIDIIDQDLLAIAFNVLVDHENDNYEVFTMNMVGSELKNVTNLNGVEWTYYSYQDKLYFISDKDTCQRCSYHLYETDYLGQGIRKISEIPLADSWMSSRRDGTEFIVKPNSKYDSAFYIIDLSGNLLQRLVVSLPSYSDPLFINDGEQVVFRGGTKKSKREASYSEELYIINANGTGLSQLTNYPQSDTSAPWYAYKAGPPKLHPTEDFISYQSFQDGKYSLFAVSTDGSKQWKITENAQSEGWHDWSPDGIWLAIEFFDKDQTQFDIGLMNWQTKEVKILTDSTYKYQQAPNFVMKKGRLQIE